MPQPKKAREVRLDASLDDLAETLREVFAQLPVAPGISTLAFLAEALVFVRAWIEHHHLRGTAGAAPGALLYSEELRPDGEKRAFERLSYFRADVRHPMAGCITLCSSSLADAYQAPTQAETIAQLANELRVHELQKRPTIIVIPNDKKVLVCPHGIDDPEESYELEIPIGASDEVSVESVTELLERFYVAYVRTPRRYKKLWKTPRKYVPMHDVEKEIQHQLVPVTRMRFFEGFRVDMEIDTDEGRVDIVVEAVSGSNSSGSCILELKVLRSKYPSRTGQPTKCPPKDNRAALVKGIDQADSYRTARGYQLAFLVCYDFREDSDPAFLDPYRTIAKTRDVEIEWFPVFPDAETARKKRPNSAYEEALELGLLDV